MSLEEMSEYIRGLVGEGDDLLAWVGEISNKLTGVVHIDSNSGRLLELLTRARAPKRILEVGAGAGYSAICLMKGMSANGILDAIEQNPNAVEAFKVTVRKAGLEGRVRIHKGRALKVLPKMKTAYDMVFIDANKEEYPNYLEHALRLTCPGSIIVADNMFWKGATIRRERSGGTQGIVEYTRRIFDDPRLSSLIVPLGDGLAVSYRTK
jgi:predicted O-methyltransferase YrrM